ncbi:MAG TPA: hypothetical protein VGF06_11580, partial [Terriglobales bacterium]
MKFNLPGLRCYNLKVPVGRNPPPAWSSYPSPLFDMSAFRPIAVVILIGLSLTLSAQASQNLSLHHPRRKKPKAEKTVQELPPAPVQPPAPLTLAEQPAVPPQVTYQNGMLGIVADNCVLADVLRAIHSQTGAAIEIPANATERVALRLGPGPPREVLASLLNGSHFDYVLLGTTANPNALAQVILMTKTLPGPADVAANQNTFAAPPPNRPMPDAAASEDDSDMEVDNGDADEEQPEAPPTSAPPQNAPASGVKTPEQLLQELQRQQQQLQQQ